MFKNVSLLGSAFGDSGPGRLVVCGDGDALTGDVAAYSIGAIMLSIKTVVSGEKVLSCPSIKL